MEHEEEMKEEYRAYPNEALIKSFEKINIGISQEEYGSPGYKRKIDRYAIIYREILRRMKE